MYSLYYYFAAALAIGLIFFGALYIIYAVYEILAGSRIESLFAGRSIVLWRFLSGIANILIGTTLYWHLEDSMTSTILVLLTMSAFTLWEWYVRTYFVENQAEGERPGRGE